MGKVQVHPMSLSSRSVGETEVYAAPYPLGCVVAHAKAYGEGKLTEHFDFRPITPVRYEAALAQVDAVTEPGIFLFSSYVWNHDANLTVAAHVKRRFPRALVIFGGPQMPRRSAPLRDVLEKNPFIDLVVRGEGEEALADVLETIASSGATIDTAVEADFSAIAGLTYRRGSLVQTPDRAPSTRLGTFPSPYTTGLFDHWVDGTTFMALETNRGCPYRCTFCDWGASTLTKVRPLSLERVFGEIEYCGRHKIHVVLICDANFGILKRDVEIAEHMVRVRERYGYPTLVSYNNAKVVRPELQKIIVMFRDAGLNALGQVAIQTIDRAILDNVKRANITSAEYDKLVGFFREQSIPAFSDIMLGLPGTTLDTYKADLQFLFDRRIHSRIFPVFVTPNAEMADPTYQEQHGIEVDADGFVARTSSFGADELERMVELSFAYKLYANFGTGMFKYLLLFMQLDLGVRALDYLAAWLALVGESPDRFPTSHRLYREVLAPLKHAPGRDMTLLSWNEALGAAVFGDLDAVLGEAVEIGASAFGMRSTGSDVDAVVRAQALVLPSPTSAAGRFDTPHDVAAYFATVAPLVNLDERPPSFLPLRDYGPGTVEVMDSRRSLAYTDFYAPYVRLELESNLRC